MVLPLLDTATELLTSIIVPQLEVRDLVALGRSSRLLHRLLLAKDSAEAEYIWKRRIKNDLRFPVESTARQSGWLELYRKIRIPHVYLWGEGQNGRLAIERNDPRVEHLQRGGFLAEPARLPIRVPIVDLVAGGCSFHALSADGKVYHWGQLDGESFAPIRPLNNPNGPPVPLTAWPGAMVPAVTQLAADIPPISRLLSGRTHVLALDERDRLWTWANWAEAGVIDPTSSTNVDTDAWLDYSKHRIRDVAAGWAFSAILLEDRKTGQRSAHAWWQRFQSPSLEQSQLRPNFGNNNANDNAAGAIAIEGRSGCYNFAPQQVLRLPDLPARTASADEVIEKLAAGDNYLIALTSFGKVYKLDLSKPNLGPGAFAHHPAAAGGHLHGLVPEQNDNSDNEDGRMARRNFAELERLVATGRREWEYLERFSESRYWQATEEAGGTPDAETDKDESANTRTIKFISANFRTFFCIGGGAVLQGSNDTGPATGPLIRPELQNHGVIRVECGDWHYGALTASGELLTFGGYSKGALGHGANNARLEASLRGGPDRAISVPSRVSFLDPAQQRLGGSTSPGPDEYCFNVAMAGWHSGALCVNLQSKAEDEADELDVRSARLKAQEKGKAKARAEGTLANSPADSESVSGASASLRSHDHVEHLDDQDEPEVPIGAHRRLLPGVLGRGRMPFRIGYAGRGAMRGARGRGGMQESEEM